MLSSRVRISRNSKSKSRKCLTGAYSVSSILTLRTGSHRFSAILEWTPNLCLETYLCLFLHKINNRPVRTAFTFSLWLGRLPPIVADFVGMFHFGKCSLDRDIGLLGQISGAVTKCKHGTHELLELLSFFPLEIRSFHFQCFCLLHAYSLSSPQIFMK